MYAIASLLDPTSDQIVRGIWERFEEHCGLTGIKMAPLPHFSWQGAETYQFAQVEEALEDISAQIKPFRVQTSGLGIFTGPKPVVYIALVKDRNLMDVHNLLWNRLLQFSIQPNMYYTPDRWVPHITVAIREVEADRLGCSIADIAFQKIDLTITVDHIALIYVKDEKAGIKSRFRLNQAITV